MPRSHAPYPAQFRQQMVELVHAGRTPVELAREFNCSAQAIRNWTTVGVCVAGATPPVDKSASELIDPS